MFSSIKNNINELGLPVTICYSIHRLLSKLSSKSGVYLYHLYEQPFNHKNTQSVKPNSLYFCWSEEFTAEHLLLPRPVDVLKERFNQNSKCLMVKNKEDFAGCIWFGLNNYIEDEVKCVFCFDSEQQYVWDYDVFIEPKYRMSRVFFKMWSYAESALVSQGYRATLSRISAYNIRSINSHIRLGAQDIGWACFLNIFGMQLMVSKFKPFVHLSFGKSNHVYLKIK